MNYDNIYMQRAIELASLARGYTLSNPLVGAVLVHQGRIIAEGYHHRWGEEHAEVCAIRSVKAEDSHKLRESTLYVSLEPCSHHGKTPPCADLIIEHKIPRVVVAQLDPYPEVAGRGVERLRRAGIAVEVGCLEAEARYLNKGFNTYHSLQRPYILLKWAESTDGYIDAMRAVGEGVPVVFSSPYRQRLVHRSRRDYQAILVGAKTVLQDNPSLTNRYWGEIQPLRVVLDWDLSLRGNFKLYQDKVASTWVIYDKALATPQESGHSFLRYCPIEVAEGGRVEALVRFLYDAGVQSLFVEGGAKTLQMFLDSGYYDEIRRERSKLCLGKGVRSPR